MKYILAIAAFCLSGLAHAQFGGTDYNGNEARRAMPVKTGVVIDVVSSVIDSPASTTSRVVGASAAGLACGIGTRNVSNWSTRSAVVGLCGLLGERAGAYIGAETRVASTLVVRLSNGDIVGIAQQDPNIRVGSAVYVLSGGPTTRVVLASAGFPSAGR